MLKLFKKKKKDKEKEKEKEKDKERRATISNPERLGSSVLSPLPSTGQSSSIASPTNNLLCTKIHFFVFIFYLFCFSEHLKVFFYFKCVGPIKF
jgi:hypothetical protein